MKRVSLYVSDNCENCVGVRGLMQDIVKGFDIRLEIYSVERDPLTHELVLVNEDSAVALCPPLPGLPLIQYGDKCFVGKGCCDFFSKEIKNNAA